MASWDGCIFNGPVAYTASAIFIIQVNPCRRLCRILITRFPLRITCLKYFIRVKIDGFMIIVVILCANGLKVKLHGERNRILFTKCVYNCAHNEFSPFLNVLVSTKVEKEVSRIVYGFVKFQFETIWQEIFKFIK